MDEVTAAVDVTVTLPNATVRRLRVLAAQEDIQPRTMLVKIIEEGVLRREQLERRKPPRDRATKFKWWLIETRGYKPNSARSVSSLVRRAVKSGDLVAFARLAPASQRYSVHTALKLWADYCQLLNLEPTSLDEP